MVVFIYFEPITSIPESDHIRTRLQSHVIGVEITLYYYTIVIIILIIIIIITVIMLYYSV